MAYSICPKQWVILPEMEAAGIGTREEKNRVRNSLVELIQHAAEEAIMMLSAITPAGYMVYLQSLCHSWTQDWLSKSCYGNKQSDLFNLFRLHIDTGFTVDFEQELSNLLHGFYQIIAVENHYGLGEICEGKDPMNNQHITSFVLGSLS